MELGVAIIGCGDRGTAHARTWKDRADARACRLHTIVRLRAAPLRMDDICSAKNRLPLPSIKDVGCWT